MKRICPRLSDEGLVAVREIESYNQFGQKQKINIAGEEPLTIKIDGKEVVTLMTLGMYPELLVLGYLRNQGLFKSIFDIQSVTVNWDREIAEVKTEKNQINKLFYKKTNRDNVQYTNISDFYSPFILKNYQKKTVPVIELRRSQIYHLIQEVKKHNDIYRYVGSVHGCGLCQDIEIIKFIEDVGRHCATDTLSGYMWLNNIQGYDKIFYTTGRLTSEIVIKSAMMGIPVLISRNGITNSGFTLARQLGVTLVFRAKGKHFLLFQAHNLQMTWSR